MEYNGYEREDGQNSNTFAMQNNSTGTAKSIDAKKKKLITVIAVLVAAVLLIYAASTLIQKASIVGKYYEFYLRNGEEEVYLGEKEYMEITFDGKIISGRKGFQAKYKYKSGNITITASAFGFTVVQIGTIKDGVLTLDDGTCYKKADKYPGIKN